jgi:hypothetical protein
VVARDQLVADAEHDVFDLDRDWAWLSRWGEREDQGQGRHD